MRVATRGSTFGEAVPERERRAVCAKPEWSPLALNRHTANSRTTNPTKRANPVRRLSIHLLRARSRPALAMASHSPPVELSRLLERAKSRETADGQTWQEATETAITWLLSIKPREREAVVHWFCHAGGLEPGWSCSVFLLRLLAFKPNGEIAEWREQLFKLLTACPDCAVGYQRAKAEFVTE